MKMVPELIILLFIPCCSKSMKGDVIKLIGTVNTTKDYITVLEGLNFTALELTLSMTYKANFYSACSGESPCFPYFIIGRGEKNCGTKTRGTTCKDFLATIGNLHVYKQSLRPEAASLVGSYCTKRQNTVSCLRKISVSSGKSVLYSFCFHSCYSIKGIQLEYAINIREINFTECFENNFKYTTIKTQFFGAEESNNNKKRDLICRTYKKAILPGFVGFNSERDLHIANSKFNYVGGYNGLKMMRSAFEACYQHSKAVACRYVIPECRNSTAVFPCKKSCEAMNRYCKKAIDCDNFPETYCFYEDINCGNITEIKNGDYAVDSFGLGSNVTYTCNEGFEISGSPSAICQANGTWSQKAPTCQEKVAPGPSKYAVVTGVSICLVLVLAIVMTFFLLIRRYKLRRRSKSECEGEPYHFHAFVSYSSNDADFVEEDFRIFLEENQDPAFHLCLHSRNFIPGQSIHGNIMAAIESSAMCFIMLSYSYIRSPWCSHEFSVAYNRMVTDGLPTNSIVMVLLDKIQREDLPLDMKAFSYECTYIEFSNKHFWTQVLSAIKSGTKLMGAR